MSDNKGIDRKPPPICRNCGIALEKVGAGDWCKCPTPDCGHYIPSLAFDWSKITANTTEVTDER